MEISTYVDPQLMARVAVSGEVDVSVADQLRVAGEQAIAAPDCAGLIIELDAVTFLDSTGLGALVALRNAALDSDVAFELRGVPDPVRRILELTGMDAVFDIAPAEGVAD
jgi:anti-sigma B factor antagonist